MPAILKKLRLKFMLMTTGIVGILVIVIASVYCVGVISSASTEIDIALEHAINASSGQDRFPAPPQDQLGGPNDQEMKDTESDQRIDLFRGRSALVYSVVIDAQGNILRNDSPAIELDDEVLTRAIDAILDSPDFSNAEGSTSSGKLGEESLFYQTKIVGGNIYLGLTDSATFDERIREAILSSVALVGLALVLTIVISFFLARLFLRPVEDAWNKQRRFIADASHELKTPLTVIMANTEIVRSVPEETVESQMKWLNGTMDESERMQGLIADLLLLARMDDENAHSGHAAQEIVDFSRAVENALVSFEAIAFERELTFEDCVADDIKIKGNTSRLSRLPDILIDNACKYAEAKGLVKVDLDQRGDKAVLRVFNTGPEIAPADITHLFDRFYRADESRCDDIPGYGLGLSIAQSIVEECGGSITVENVAGEGVAFTATLPLTA